VQVLKSMMRIDFPVRVDYLMPIAGIILEEEEQEGTIINQPVFAQIGVPSGILVLNEQI
jgi:hypothetical protein